MQFNPATQKIEISPQDATTAYHDLLNALKHIRLLAGRPLDKHSREVGMDNADFAGKSIIDAAKGLGITMGADWPEQLDLRNV